MSETNEYLLGVASAIAAINDNYSQNCYYMTTLIIDRVQDAIGRPLVASEKDYIVLKWKDTVNRTEYKNEKLMRDLRCVRTRKRLLQLCRKYEICSQPNNVGRYVTILVAGNYFYGNSVEYDDYNIIISGNTEDFADGVAFVLQLISSHKFGSYQDHLEHDTNMWDTTKVYDGYRYNRW